MELFDFIKLIWCFSPVILIPLSIAMIARKSKLEKFIYQLYREKRISLIEMTNKRTEVSADRSRAPQAYYGVRPQQPHQPQQQSAAFWFVGPPLPPELLQQRREMAAAQEAAKQAPVSAVKSVTDSIAAASSAAPVAEIALSEAVRPAAELAQTETGPAAGISLSEAAAPAAEPVVELKKPEPQPAHSEAANAEPALDPAQPYKGSFGNFIGPPIPPEIIAQRRTMSAASARTAQKPAPAPVPVPQKRTINPASAMLVIGSALVIIAGMIFSTANWNSMSDWQRTGVIAVMAAFFFGVSAVAHKKLKLENTGMAFYMLGSVFTSITFVTVGYFGLFGEWLSVNGKGFWLLYSLAALLVTLFSAGAVKLYNKGAFVHAVLYGGLCSFTLMSLQIFGDRPDVWALFLNIIAAVPLFLLYKQKLRVGSELYDNQMKLFTVVLTVIYAVAALPFMLTNLNGGWTAACFLTMLVWIAQAMAYSILLDNSLLRNIHPLLTIITIAELALSAKSFSEPDRLLIFGVCTFAAAAAYRYIRQIRTDLSDLAFPAVMLMGSLFAGSEAHRGGQFAVCAGLFLAMFVIQSITREETEVSRFFTAAMPVAALASAASVPDLIYRSTDLSDVAVVTIYAGIAFALALVFNFVKPIRTLLSDAVFPIALFVCYSMAAGSTMGDNEIIMTFGVAVMFLASVLIRARENDENSKAVVYRYVLPFVLAVFAQSVTGLVNQYIDTDDMILAFAFGCTMFAGAAAVRFIPRLRTRVSDYANVIILAISALVCRANVWNADGHWFAAGLIAMLIVLIAFECFDGDALNDHRLFAFAMPISVIWLAAETARGVSRAVYDIGDSCDMLFGLVFMLFVFAAAFVFMNVKRIKTAVSAAAFPMALMGAGILLFTVGVWNSALLGAVSFALMAVLMLIQNGESGLAAEALRYFLAVPFIGISVCSALAIKLTSEIGGDGIFCLWAGLFIVLFGLAFRFAGRIGLNVRTILSDIAFTVLGCGFAVAAYSEKPFYAAWVLLALSVLVITNIYQTRPKHRHFVLFSRWLLPCVLSFTAVSVCASIVDRFALDDMFAKVNMCCEILFSVLMLTMAIVFLHIRRIRTAFSDFVIPGVLAVLCIENLNSGSVERCISAIVCCSMLCGMLLMYALEKEGEPHQIVHRLLAPLAFLPAAIVFGELLCDDKTMLYDLGMKIAILSGALIAGCAAAAFSYLGKQDGEKRFLHSQYAWSALTGLMLSGSATFDYDASTAVFVLCIAGILLSAAFYMLCGTHKVNIAGVFPVIAMLMSINGTARQMSFAAGSGLAGTEHKVYTVAVAGAVFMLLCGISRYVSRDRIAVHENGRITLDFASFAMAAIPFVTLANSGDTISAEWCRFIAVAELAVFFLNLIRKGHKRQTNLTMLTLAAAAGCALIYVRPFMHPDDKMVAAKINLIPLLLFSILVRYIWKEKQKLASDLSFVVQLAAFAVLLFDALTNQSLANTIIVLCVTLTIMLVSFAVRSGRWFAISAASFLGLTIYITRGFIGRVEWWAYLLTAGLILIVVASVNEYMKSRGQTLKDAGKHFLSRWKKR